jgi:hypothetical protein
MSPMVSVEHIVCPWPLRLHLFIWHVTVFELERWAPPLAPLEPTTTTPSLEHCHLHHRPRRALQANQIGEREDRVAVATLYVLVCRAIGG